MSMKFKRLFTIGHSTHPLNEFFDYLHHYGITHLIDIRTIPQSRYVPWFNKENLNKSSVNENITYIHMKNLGGLRKPLKNSINSAWKNSNFRGFADYMQTSEFYHSLKELNNSIKKGNCVAIMCAEAVPWRCHRSLIADAEVIRGIEVVHIINKASVINHKLTSFAKINKNTKPLKIYYPSSSSN